MILRSDGCNGPTAAQPAADLNDGPWLSSPGCVLSAHVCVRTAKSAAIHKSARVAYWPASGHSHLGRRSVKISCCSFVRAKERRAMSSRERAEPREKDQAEVKTSQRLFWAAVVPSWSGTGQDFGVEILFCHVFPVELPMKAFSSLVLMVL